MNASAQEIPPHKLISTLRSFDLLPAIVFMPTRRKCDEAATAVAFDRSQKGDPNKLAGRQTMFAEYAIDNPELRRHKHRKILVDRGVASHHAGHIPAWKLLIEKMMSAGLLNAIFATSTVAAGVDFPARTVVIINADTRGNEGWRPLRASELQQMTGRAGRRGKDNVGFVVAAPGQFQNPKKIAELLKAPPDPLESRFRATYTTLLNLLDAFGNFDQIRDIAEKSFAFRKTSHKIRSLENDLRRAGERINGFLAETSYKYNDVRGFERLVAARNRLHEAVPTTRAEMRSGWLFENVKAGRLVSRGRSGKRLYMVISSHNGKVSAMRDDGGGTSFDINDVSRVYREVYPLKAEAIERAFFDAVEGRNKPLREPNLSAAGGVSDETAEIFSTATAQIANTADGDKALWESLEAAQDSHRIERDIEYLKSEIWEPFEVRAKILDHFGYINFADQAITERGKWLADLRVDRPLLIGEALRNGTFNEMTPVLASGFMAALTADSDRNYGELRLSDKLIETIEFFDRTIFSVADIEHRYNIDYAEEVNFSAAAATENWAGGIEWDQLVKHSGAEEGDLFRLLSRTGEALMQIAHQKGENAAAADIARRAAELILREPVR